MSNWRMVDHFPNYEVNGLGEVRNALTGRVLKTKANQQGQIGVGLMRDGVQHHRSVATLVAHSFIRRPLPHFDTPINKDGDKNNNSVDNIVWRPRWYAVEYNRQFREPYWNPITKPVKNVETGEVYETSWQCAITNGLLEKDVVLAILNKTYTFPNYQTFEPL